MNAYMYQADLHCEDCIGKIVHKIIMAYDKPPDLKELAALDSDKYPQGPFPNGGGEADSPQHCGSCGLFLENPLTSDGEDYVKLEVSRVEVHLNKEGLAVAETLNTIHKWQTFYSYLFED